MVETRVARQFYGDSSGGYVECCEEVVDPIILLGVIAAIAGATFFLRQQVLTFISGRRSFTEGNIENSILEHTKGIDFLIDVFESKYAGENVEDSLFCYPKLGTCLVNSLALNLKEKPSTDLDLFVKTSSGLAEYWSTGSIKSAWKELKQIELVRRTSKCLKYFHEC